MTLVNKYGIILVQGGMILKSLVKLRIKQNIKIKRLLAIEVIFCVLVFLLATGFQNYKEEYKDSQNIVVGIDNKDDSAPASMLVSNFQSTEHFANLFRLELMPSNEFKEKMKNGEIDAGIEVPEKFAEGLYHFENRPIKLIVKTSTPLKNTILEETLSGYSYYVRAVDMACYVYNDIVRNKENDKETIKKYEDAITFDLLYATLSRKKYFEEETISKLPIINSREYYLLALPFSLLAFISLTGAIKKIKEKDLSIEKRIKTSGISTFKQVISDYISELLFMLIIFLPILIYRALTTGFKNSFIFFISIIIASLFFSALWKALAQLIKKKESLLVLCVSIAFLNAIVSGAIVPYLLLPLSIKELSDFSLNFKLAKFTMGGGNFVELLPFLLAFILLFVFDVYKAEKEWNIQSTQK